jgi:hypothetical protein
MFVCAQCVWIREAELPSALRLCRSTTWSASVLLCAKHSTDAHKTLSLCVALRLRHPRCGGLCPALCFAQKQCPLVILLIDVQSSAPFCHSNTNP